MRRFGVTVSFALLAGLMLLAVPGHGGGLRLWSTHTGGLRVWLPGLRM